MEHAIQRLLAVRPFVPFQIRLSNQDRYTVDAPDLAMIETDCTITMFRRKPGSQQGRERIGVLAIQHVVSVVEDDDHGVPY
jgi:hypothetical protein